MQNVGKIILVTGADGFVGKVVCRRLLQAGYVPRAALRSANLWPSLQAAIPEMKEWISIGDLSSTPDLDGAVEGVTGVIHLAARVHVMQDLSLDPLDEYRRVNLHGTELLARAAAGAGVRRMVFVSTAKVNGESTPTGAFSEEDVPSPQDPYSISKWEAEKALHSIAATTRLEIVIVRPPLVYGAGVRANFLRLMKLTGKGIPMPLPDTRNRRSLLGVQNLADFLVRCMEDPRAANQTFLVSDGEDLSTRELVEQLAIAFGRKAHFLPAPVFAVRLAAKILRKEAAVERLFGSLSLDSRKAQIMLDWTPPVTIAEGFADTVHAYLESSRLSPLLQKRPGLIGSCTKRVFDVICGAFLLVLFAVPMALIALAIKLTSKGPMLYWSNRVGQNNKKFFMPKFRSMRVNAPQVATHLLTDPDSHLTSIGGFLRRSSLDELPQLFSVLCGDLSLVGPRPALFNQDDLVALRTECGVHQLVPGITGWAQVNGRDDLPIPEKVRLDFEYLRRQSLLFDLHILGLTILKVARQDGVSH
jgi:lipopolysaccharide/colanic/teichoic acid biosynthesis glycosyltransferase/nucleoside-diphosphate-sugar epimerase